MILSSEPLGAAHHSPRKAVSATSGRPLPRPQPHSSNAKTFGSSVLAGRTLVVRAPAPQPTIGTQQGASLATHGDATDTERCGGRPGRGGRAGWPRRGARGRRGAAGAAVRGGGAPPSARRGLLAACCGERPGVGTSRLAGRGRRGGCGCRPCPRGWRGRVAARRVRYFKDLCATVLSSTSLFVMPHCFVSCSLQLPEPNEFWQGGSQPETT